MRLRTISFGLMLFLATVSCATSGNEAASDGTSGSAGERSSESATARPGLHATLWMQRGAEREALARQAYQIAKLRLDQALESPEWTASVEQEEMGDYQEKPPAVVVDVDETVLDNSAYQARRVKKGKSFDIESWNDWCREAAAPAIPGALDFLTYAAEQDVTVFYVTNREHEVEDSTRKNLEKLGFPMADDRDVILTKYEKEGWDSDKTPRRKKIAKDFRILLLMGDNLGDFVGETEVKSAKRSGKVERWEKRWGKQWIAMANPMYGDWESSAYEYNHDLERRERIQRKLDALETKREASDD